MRWLPLLAALPLISGCSAPADPEGVVPPAGDGAAGGPAAVAVFDDTFAVDELAVSAANGYHGLDGANCLRFDGRTQVLAGNVTVEWDSGPAASPHMDLEVAQAFDVLASASGPSPLTVELPALVSSRDTMIRWGAAHAAPYSLADAQGSMRVRLSYDAGGAAPAFKPGSCGW